MQVVVWQAVATTEVIPPYFSLATSVARVAKFNQNNVCRHKILDFVWSEPLDGLPLIVNQRSMLVHQLEPLDGCEGAVD
jgi:hypothetical protein